MALVKLKLPPPPWGPDLLHEHSLFLRHPRRLHLRGELQEQAHQ